MDIVCDLPQGAIDPLAAALADEYYVDAEMIHEAVAHCDSFNVIHLETMLKVDVFLLKPRPFDQEAFRRGIVDTLADTEEARTFVLASPEDMVLHKLGWGHGTSCTAWSRVKAPACGGWGHDHGFT